MVEECAVGGRIGRAQEVPDKLKTEGSPPGHSRQAEEQSDRSEYNCIPVEFILWGLGAGKLTTLADVKARCRYHGHTM